MFSSLSFSFKGLPSLLFSFFSVLSPSLSSDRQCAVALQAFLYLVWLGSSRVEHQQHRNGSRKAPSPRWPLTKVKGERKGFRLLAFLSLVVWVEVFGWEGVRVASTGVRCPGTFSQPSTKCPFFFLQKCLSSRSLIVFQLKSSCRCFFLFLLMRQGLGSDVKGERSVE